MPLVENRESLFFFFFFFLKEGEQRVSGISDTRKITNESLRIVTRGIIIGLRLVEAARVRDRFSSAPNEGRVGTKGLAKDESDFQRDYKSMSGQL